MNKTKEKTEFTGQWWYTPLITVGSRGRQMSVSSKLIWTTD